MSINLFGWRACAFLFVVFVVWIIYGVELASGWVIFSGEIYASSCSKTIVINDVSDHKEFFSNDIVWNRGIKSPAFDISRRHLVLPINRLVEIIGGIATEMSNLVGLGIAPEWICHSKMVQPKCAAVTPCDGGDLAAMVYGQYRALDFIPWDKRGRRVSGVLWASLTPFPNVNAVDTQFWRERQGELIAIDSQLAYVDYEKSERNCRVDENSYCSPSSPRAYIICLVPLFIMCGFVLGCKGAKLMSKIGDVYCLLSITFFTLGVLTVIFAFTE